MNLHMCNNITFLSFKVMGKIETPTSNTFSSSTMSNVKCPPKFNEIISELKENSTQVVLIFFQHSSNILQIFKVVNVR